MGAVSFGSYTFPATLKEFSDNFRDGVPSTVQLPGKAGGYNQDGDESLPTQMGQVTVGFTLIADDREGMDALRDAVAAMQTMGYKKLVYQPTDPDEEVRYCWAYVHYISMSRREDLHTDLWQDVQAIFHVPDPHWYVDDPDVPKFDATYDFDATITFGEGAAVYAASGTETSITIIHNGSGVALPILTVEPDTGDTCENPEVRRVDSEGVLRDFVRYTGVLTDADILAIEAARQAVTKNGANAFANTKYGSPALIRLFPGSNTLKVRFKNAGDAANVRVYIRETYK